MADNDTGNTQEMGVDFGELYHELENHDYPADSEEIIGEYGDAELVFSNGSTTLSELLEPLGTQTFESAESVRQAVLNMVGDEAIGRKNYSDRTPPDVGEERQDEGAPDQEVEDQESF